MKVPAQYVHLIDIMIAIDEYGMCATGCNAKNGDILQCQAYPIIVPQDIWTSIQEHA